VNSHLPNRMPSTDLDVPSKPEPVPRQRTGLLLVNLGTPDSPRTPDVRRYLREFLSDPRVLDLHPVGRWLLLHLIILPFRPSKSAHAYQTIWTARGSPLLNNSQDLARAVEKGLAGEYEVELAMRYGNPSIASALEKLKARGVTRLLAMPLYPQNAASSTSSSLDRIYEVVRKGWEVLPVDVIPPFFDAPGFIEAFAQTARPVIEEMRADHVLFSFHGIPVRHVKKSDPSSGYCQASHCCDTLTDQNRTCYRAQSFHTARSLASRLGLPKEKYSVSFQSRLGRTEWVKPYTDFLLPELAQRGVKRLAVMCPAFVADCLETLEEIGIRAREQFLAAGGEELRLVPSLNASPRWVQAVVELVRAHG